MHRGTPAVPDPGGESLDQGQEQSGEGSTGKKQYRMETDRHMRRSKDRQVLGKDPGRNEVQVQALAKCRKNLGRGKIQV